jgi:hypothetical protein
MKGRTLTPIGIIAVVLLVVGLLLLILASSVVLKVIGVVIACVALLGFLGGQPASQRMAGFARPAMKDNISEMGVGHMDEPAPEYIEAAPEAPDSVWEHEKQLYEEKAEHEHPGGDQPG